MKKIYVDFHNADIHGRIRLITNGTFDDIDRQNIKLESGLNILLYNDDDGEGYPVLEATAVVLYSKEEEIWVGEIVQWS
jgi:hypothetical protein